MWWWQRHKCSLSPLPLPSRLANCAWLDLSWVLLLCILLITLSGQSKSSNSCSRQQERTSTSDWASQHGHLHHSAEVQTSTGSLAMSANNFTELIKIHLRKRRSGVLEARDWPYRFPVTAEDLQVNSERESKCWRFPKLFFHVFSCGFSRTGRWKYIIIVPIN